MFEERHPGDPRQQDRAGSFVAETPGGQRLTLKDGPASLRLEDNNQNALVFEADGVALTTGAVLTLNASRSASPRA